MPIFFCRVVDEKGKANEFIREALSEEILIRELSANKFFPLIVKEADKRISKRKKFSKNSIIEFTDTLSLLLSSGLTLKDALAIAQTIFIKGKLNEMTALFLQQIEKGASFHEVLRDLGESFPPMYKGLIKIGEKVGSLESAFKVLSLYLSEEQKLKEKFIGSMIYPAIVLSVAMLGILAIFTFILPKIKGIFSQLNSQLPQHIESMISILNFIIIICGVVAVFTIFLFFVISFIRKKGGSIAEKLDRLLLKIPIFGQIKLIRESLNFLFAMETLTTGGFTVEDALLEASNVVSNLSFRSGILQVRMKILKGEMLSMAFMGNPVFPERLSRWISIGEKSGHVEKAFRQLCVYYQGEVDKWSSRFMNLIEPVLILFVAAIIFLFIIFFVMPIFSIYGSL